MGKEQKSTGKGTWRPSKTVEGIKTTRPVDHGNGRRSAISTTAEPETWTDDGWEPTQ